MVAIIEAVQTAFATLNTIMAANPILLIVAAIAALVAGFMYLWNTSENFRNFWIKLWEGIKTVFENVWKTIETFFTETIPLWIQNVIDLFKNLPYNIGLAIGEIIGHIIQFGIDAYNWVTTELPKIINNIVDWFTQLPDRILNCLVNALNNIIQWIVNMANKVKEGIPQIVNNIKNFFNELPQSMLNIGKNIVEGLWNGIKNAGNWIKGKIKEFASGILDGMKNALGIHSPSKLFRDEIGKFIPQGVAVGIEADTDSALKAIRNMNDDIVAEMNNAVIVEKSSTAIQAGLLSNKEDAKTTINDKGVNINNTQNFYSKNSTPYEEQKQAKQQLRRLAYEL